VSDILRILRERPELWFVPAIVLSLVTAFTEIGEAALGPAVLRRLALTTPDPILPFTLTAALVTAPFLVLQMRRRTSLSRWRAVVIGASVPVGAVGLFEIPYQEIRAAAFPGLAGVGLPTGAVVALTAWILVGFSGIGWMRFDRVTAALGLALILGFAAWWALGYPQVVTPPGGNLPIAYAFNVGLKWLCFTWFAALILRGLPSRDPSSDGDGPEAAPHEPRGSDPASHSG
jgi:hypothetical protein